MGAAVACAAGVRAATESYQLSEEYTADNFFEKFDFFESTYTSGDSWDSTHGYVRYRNQADAESLGLISTSDGQIYLGPDMNSTYDPDGKGRDSIRITSKATYNQGLMVAKFSHMPVQACGAWPAFWSFADPWLTSGEIDYYEGWNLMGYNRMAMHTNETIAGSCTLSSTGIEGTVMTEDCVQTDDGAGCGVSDESGVWGSTTGATFAMEWTDSAIKIWNWLPAAVPADITAGTPDPSSGSWGNPTLLVEQTSCDLASSFANQQIVFNIDFCGDTAGSPTFWNATCSAFGDSCASYVANTPSAFTELYFKIEGIQFYEMGVATEAVSSSVAVTSSTAVATSAPAAVTSSTTSAILGGIAAGAGSVLDSTLSAAPTTTVSHSTGYVYATSVTTDETGSETTVVVVVDTTICPITATESSAVTSATSVDAQAVTTPADSAPPTTRTASSTLTSTATLTSSVTLRSTATLTRSSTLTSAELTTSTIFSTSSSTITSCASTATSCAVGDVTTVVIAVSTTICPVTAAEATSSSSSITTPSAATSLAPPAPVSTNISTSDNSPVDATPSPSTIYSTLASTVTHSTAVTLTTSSPDDLSSTEVVSATDIGSELLTASSAPTSVAINWGDESAGTLVLATATGSYAASNASVTSASSASATGSGACSGLDCIVVSSGGARMGGVGLGGIALVVLAGGVFLL